MRMLLRILAILALLATLAGAGIVLYGIQNLSPEIVGVRILQTPAEEAQEHYDELSRTVTAGTYPGTVFAEALPEAKDCTFVTYSVRMKNRGFLPAEWIILSTEPGSGDLAIPSQTEVWALNPGTTGDLSLTLLCEKGREPDRTLKLTYYILGNEMKLEIETEGKEAF